MKRWESSETRFGKVSRRSEPCSRGKRPFKVSQTAVDVQILYGQCVNREETQNAFYRAVHHDPRTQYRSNRKNAMEKKTQKIKMPLLNKLSRSPRDSFESEPDSSQSQDDRLNSQKFSNDQKIARMARIWTIFRRNRSSRRDLYLFKNFRTNEKLLNRSN